MINVRPVIDAVVLLLFILCTVVGLTLIYLLNTTVDGHEFLMYTLLLMMDFVFLCVLSWVTFFFRG